MPDEETPDPLADIRGTSPEADELLKEYYGQPEPEGSITRLHVVAEPTTPRAPLLTNAPPGWPPVPGPVRFDGDPDAFAGVLALVITRALSSAGLPVVELHREVELSEFTLVVDLVVRHEGRDVPILILPGANPAQEMTDFGRAKAALEREGPYVGAPVVFYTPSGAAH